MAEVSYTSRALTEEEISKLKDEIRHYFIEVDCNLRVLGSQLGLKTSELNELDRLSEQARTDFKELLFEKCFEKEKIMSWHQFVAVLEKPALGQRRITKEIKSRFLMRQPTDSRSPRLKASFSSRIEIETGGSYKEYIAAGCACLDN